MPVIRPTLTWLRDRVGRSRGFAGSASYWEQRYQQGGHSGAGSYGRLADFKAAFLNEFVADNRIHSVVEYGCGDGNQLSLARYPEYIGVDVSEQALRICRARFAGDDHKAFLAPHEADGIHAELALSLDVIYHLVEDATFGSYMRQLFRSAERFVIVYASNHDEIPRAKHVRHRRFTDLVARDFPEWALVRHVPNPYPFSPSDPSNTSFADFFVFVRDERRTENPLVT